MGNVVGHTKWVQYEQVCVSYSITPSGETFVCVGNFLQGALLELMANSLVPNFVLKGHSMFLYLKQRGDVGTQCKFVKAMLVLMFRSLGNSAKPQRFFGMLGKLVRVSG